MTARVSLVTKFVVLASCLVVAGTRAATAQALCPEAEAQGFGADILRAHKAVTVEAELRASGGALHGGTWRMSNSGGIASDGVALEGVSFTRNAEPALGSSLHTFDVVVALRASDNIATDLKLVVVDGDRTLLLGAFDDIVVRCEATSVSRTFSITDRDFVSFFAGGRALTLRVNRTTHAVGC